MRGPSLLRAFPHFAALLLLCAVPDARAAGVGLRWDACMADGGQMNRSFACNTNAGNLFLVSSFVLGQPLTGVRRVDVSLELATASATLPAWWDLNGCRSGAASTVSSSSIVPTACTPLAGATGVRGFVTGEHGPNTMRIEIGNDNFTLNGVTIAAGTEFVAVPLVLNVIKSTGSGACGGCAVPACIVVRGVSFTRVVNQPPVLVLDQPLNGSDANFVTWQGGGATVVSGAVGCPAATPTRRAVWGSVKALYR